MSPLTSIALAAIVLYQRQLSPYKGYCCAYAAVSGRASCSALGYRAIRRFGVWRGLGVLERRLHRCGVAHGRQSPSAALGPLARQAGFVDCGGCDLPDAGCCDGGTCGDVADVAGEACSCAPDVGRRPCRRWRQRSDADDYVVIPVRGTRQRPRR